MSESNEIEQTKRPATPTSSFHDQNATEYVARSIPAGSVSSCVPSLSSQNCDDLSSDEENDGKPSANQGESSELEQGDSQSLEEALIKHGLQLPSKTVHILSDYVELLWTWNEKLNLTRHTTYDKFVSRDLVDSIHLASLLQRGERVLDVGSGGGAPGLIVAILRPDVIVELCEATGKKATVLGEMSDKLGLDLKIWYSKAQNLVLERRFGTLTVRAVDRIYKLLEMFRASWFCFDRILMIKGPRWIEERAEARHHNMLNNLALRKLDEYKTLSSGEEFTSVILQVCPKKKIEELNRRSLELSEGKPYSGSLEEPLIDVRDRELHQNNQNVLDRGRLNDKRIRSVRGVRTKVALKNMRGASNDGSNSNSGSITRNDDAFHVFARRNGKPPKGWTGKKRDFHELVADNERRTSSNHPASKRKVSQSNVSKKGTARNNPGKKAP